MEFTILPTDRMFPGYELVDLEAPCSRCGRSTAESEEIPLLLWLPNGDMWRFCLACAGWDRSDAGPVAEDPADAG